jgi:hypothetical protein
MTNSLAMLPTVALNFEPYAQVAQHLGAVLLVDPSSLETVRAITVILTDAQVETINEYLRVDVLPGDDASPTLSCKFASDLGHVLWEALSSDRWAVFGPKDVVSTSMSISEFLAEMIEESFTAQFNPDAAAPPVHVDIERLKSDLHAPWSERSNPLSPLSAVFSQSPASLDAVANATGVAGLVAAGLAQVLGYHLLTRDDSTSWSVSGSLKPNGSFGAVMNPGCSVAFQIATSGAVYKRAIVFAAPM